MENWSLEQIDFGTTIFGTKSSPKGDVIA